MKKNLFLLLALLCMGSFVFAQKTNLDFPTSVNDRKAAVSSEIYGPSAQRACPDADLEVNQAPDGNAFDSNDFDDAYGGDLFAADAFTVTGTAALNLTSINVPGVTDGYPYEVGDSYVLTIYADAGGTPGAVACTQTFDAATIDPDITVSPITGLTGAEGAFTLNPTGCTLAPGNYWISVVFVATTPNSPFWYWGTSTDGGSDGQVFDVDGQFGPANSWLVAPFGFSFEMDLCEATGAIVLVPTMTEWGLFLFGLSMVTLGLVFVYNKQRQLA